MTTDKWRRGGLLVTGWDSIVKHRSVALAYNFLAYGSNYRWWYDSMAVLRRMPAGAKILDVPCGGGVAFQALRADHQLDYVAADISPVMLSRARREADRRGLGWVRTEEVDAQRLPFSDDHFDLCLTYMGLHCIPEPAIAISETARVLRPGGQLVGSTVVVGTGRRNDAMVRLWQRRGIFEQVHDADAVQTWLTDAGLYDVCVRRSGGIAYFTARRLADDSTGGGAGRTEEVRRTA